MGLRQQIRSTVRPLNSDLRDQTLNSYPNCKESQDSSWACCCVLLQDADIMGAEYLGQATIPISSILQGRVFRDWLLLSDTAGKPVGRTDKLKGVFEQAAVRLTIKYTPVGNEVGLCTLDLLTDRH
eukprot:GHUV01054542.1.p1 GENE.GHUV01054542.1~~GHUV01054542.1.p1  ORF type:complete len:126 (-),score=31.28 GHUV01054542.1:2-379(-)